MSCRVVSYRIVPRPAGGQRRAPLAPHSRARAPGRASGPAPTGSVPPHRHPTTATNPRYHPLVPPPGSARLPRAKSRDAAPAYPPLPCVASPSSARLPARSSRSSGRSKRLPPSPPPGCCIPEPAPRLLPHPQRSAGVPGRSAYRRGAASPSRTAAPSGLRSLLGGRGSERGRPPPLPPLRPSLVTFRELPSQTGPGRFPPPPRPERRSGPAAARPSSAPCRPARAGASRRGRAPQEGARLPSPGAIFFTHTHTHPLHHHRFQPAVRRPGWCLSPARRVPGRGGGLAEERRLFLTARFTASLSEQVDLERRQLGLASLPLAISLSRGLPLVQ